MNTNSIVVPDFFPFMTNGRHRYLGVFTTIDNNILGHYTSLYHTHFGMLTSTVEKRRWYDPEFCNFFFATIDCADTILFGDFLLLFYNFLKLSKPDDEDKNQPISKYRILTTKYLTAASKIRGYDFFL